MLLLIPVAGSSTGKRQISQEVLPALLPTGSIPGTFEFGRDDMHGLADLE